jgi:predicted nucleic acid-binding protein
MAIVVDANLLVGLAVRGEAEAVVAGLFEEWYEADEDLHAPSLIRYEVASALTRMLAVGEIADEQLAEAWTATTALSIQLHELTDGPGVIRVARQLTRESAYDAAYVALAQELGAELGPSMASSHGTLRVPSCPYG